MHQRETGREVIIEIDSLQVVQALSEPWDGSLFHLNIQDCSIRQFSSGKCKSVLLGVLQIWWHICKHKLPILDQDLRSGL